MPHNRVRIALRSFDGDSADKSLAGEYSAADGIKILGVFISFGYLKAYLCRTLSVALLEAEQKLGALFIRKIISVIIAVKGA